MKSISDQDFSSLMLKGRGRSSAVYTRLINLQLNESIIIEPSDWNRKRGPDTVCSYINRKKGIELLCRKIADGSGWAVKRAK